MGLALREWQLYLFERQSSGVDTPIDDDAGVINILTADDPSEVTIYADGAGAATASNPMTFTNGKVRFWTADSVSSIDVTGQTAKGHAFFVQGISESNHRIVVDPNRMDQCLVIPYQVVGASETVVDTGFDILANMLIKDVWLHVTTVGTGASLEVGTSTDSDGFLDAVSVATTGYPTTALEEALVSTSSLIGALLANATGTNVRKLHKRANATSGANIVYSNATSSSTAGEGYIYVNYIRVPTTGG
jgi:hypothetical protein